MEQEDEVVGNTRACFFKLVAIHLKIFLQIFKKLDPGWSGMQKHTRESCTRKKSDFNASSRRLNAYRVVALLAVGHKSVFVQEVVRI